MQLVYRKIVQLQKADPINIYFLTDMHIGHSNCDKEKLNDHVDMIYNDPFGYVFILGDNIDGRNPDHKYFDYEQTDLNIPFKKGYINNCYKYFEDEIIKPLNEKKQIILIHFGSHDKDVRYGHPYVEEICEKHDIGYGGYRAITLLNIICDNYTTKYNYTRKIKVFSHHGSGGGGTSGAKINKIESEAMSTQADIYAQGHNHYLSYTPAVIHDITTDSDKLRLIEKERYFLNCGSYFKTYQEGNFSYGEKGSFRPQITGCMKVEITPNKIEPKRITT